MKLFSRGSQADAEEDFDTVDLPTKDDLADDFFVDTAPIETPLTQDYGIEEAIALMRTLPADNNELVVTVVNQTLKSLNVEVADIVKSADEKEAKIRRQHKALEQEVKDLQAKIAKHNQEIGGLMEDLKETLDVKKRLQLALDLETKKTSTPAVARRETPNKTQTETSRSVPAPDSPQPARNSPQKDANSDPKTV